MNSPVERFVADLKTLFWNARPPTEFLVAMRDYLEKRVGHLDERTQVSYLRALQELAKERLHFFPSIADLHDLMVLKPVPTPLALPEPAPTKDELDEDVRVLCSWLVGKVRRQAVRAEAEVAEEPAARNIVDFDCIKRREARRELLAEQARTLGVSG